MKGRRTVLASPNPRPGLARWLIGVLAVVASVALVGRADASPAPGTRSAPHPGLVAPGTSPLLDRSFGHGGRVVVHLAYPPEEGLPAEIRAGGDRSLAVITGRDIIRYRPDGRLDLDFGERGRLRIGPPAPGLDFEPDSLLPESGGRFTVGGTTRSYVQGEVLTQAWPTVRRYGADGLPDPAFAQDGAFVSDLGFPPLAPYDLSEYPDGSGYFELSPATFGHPHVFLRGLRSDGRGGYLLEGEGVLTEAGCVTRLFPRTYEPFTAHLLADGDLDPAFGNGGIEKGPVVNLGCQVIRQGPETRSPSTAFIGTPRHARAIASASGVDGSGRTTLLVRTEEESGEKIVGQDYLVRLDRSGRFDRGFGVEGKARFTAPEGPGRRTDISGIHVAADGRVLIVGTIRDRGSATGRFILAEADSRGRLARGPGASAFSTIGFGEGVAPNEPTILGAGRGQVLLWSALGGFGYGNRGYVMARVTPRR